MKICAPSRRASSALSLLEVFVVIATMALMAFVFFPRIMRSVARSARIGCVNHLKQVGLAFRIYSNDHEERFPWMVSTNFDVTNVSGSREFTNSAHVFRHFQSASNELNNPKILVCPNDSAKTKATNFSNLSNTNTSYFVGLDAIETDPEMILSGDRNITGGRPVNPNLLLVGTNSTLSWTKSIHTNWGNIGLADGSVQQVNATRFNQQIASVTNATVRLAIP